MTNKHTVIITCFNKANSIETSIKSALSQDFDDLEVVVIDDCSNDYSLDIIDRFKFKIKIIKNEKNMGVLLSTLKAIRESSGSFITLLDGDDILCPGAIRLINNFLINNPHSIYYTSSIRVNSSCLTSLNNCLQDSTIYNHFNNKEFVRKNATGYIAFSFRRNEIIPLIDIFPPILIQDHIIPIILARNVERVYFSKAITHIAMNWENTTHITQNFPQMQHDAIEVYWQRVLFEIECGELYFRFISMLQFFRRVYYLDKIFGIRLRLKWIYFFKCVLSLKFAHKIKMEAMQKFREKYPIKFYS